MATVQVTIRGIAADVEAVRTGIERVLSVTGGESATDQHSLESGGTLTYILTVSADEVPGGPDEYEFSRIKDPEVYMNLRSVLNEAGMDFNFLKQQGVINPNGALTREIEVFRAKLNAHLTSLGK